MNYLPIYQQGGLTVFTPNRQQSVQGPNVNFIPGQINGVTDLISADQSQQRIDLANRQFEANRDLQIAKLNRDLLKQLKASFDTSGSNQSFGLDPNIPAHSTVLTNLLSRQEDAENRLLETLTSSTNPIQAQAEAVRITSQLDRANRQNPELVKFTRDHGRFKNLVNTLDEIDGKNGVVVNSVGVRKLTEDYLSSLSLEDGTSVNDFDVAQLSPSQFTFKPADADKKANNAAKQITERVKNDSVEPIEGFPGFFAVQRTEGQTDREVAITNMVNFLQSDRDNRNLLEHSQIDIIDRAEALVDTYVTEDSNTITTVRDARTAQQKGTNRRRSSTKSTDCIKSTFGSANDSSARRFSGLNGDPCQSNAVISQIKDIERETRRTVKGEAVIDEQTRDDRLKNLKLSNELGLDLNTEFSNRFAAKSLNGKTYGSIRLGDKNVLVIRVENSDGAVSEVPIHEVGEELKQLDNIQAPTTNSAADDRRARARAILNR